MESDRARKTAGKARRQNGGASCFPIKKIWCNRGMPIKVELESVLLDRGMMLTQLQKKVGLTLANLSILKTGKGKAIRFSTLEKICEVLDCQPGDLLRYEGTASGRRHHPRPAQSAESETAAEKPKPKSVGKPGRKPTPIVPLKMKPVTTPADIIKDDGEPELPLSPIWPKK
jgi:putative transcriptional regulator